MPSTNESHQAGPNNVISEFESLITRNIQGPMKLLNRLGSMVGEATRELCASPSRRNLPTGNELLSRWVNLNLTYYSLVSEHSIAFCEDVLSAAERTLLKTTRKTAAETTPKPYLEMTVTARVGEIAFAPFVIENHLTSLVSASFSAREFVSFTGHIVSAEAIAFEPAQLLLQPKEHAVIQAKVTVNENFRVGESYRTVLTVLGFQAHEIALLVAILPGLAETPTQAGNISRKKPSAKKRK